MCRGGVREAWVLEPTDALKGLAGDAGSEYDVPRLLDEFLDQVPWDREPALGGTATKTGQTQAAVEIARHLKLMVTRGCFGHMARKRGAAGGWIAPNTFAAQKLQDVGKGKGWFSANAERGDFSGCVRLPLRVQADRIVEEEAEEEAAAAAESTARREEREQHAKAPRGLPILVGLRERSARIGVNVFFTGDPQTMRDVGAALDFEADMKEDLDMDDLMVRLAEMQEGFLVVPHRCVRNASEGRALRSSNIACPTRALVEERPAAVRQRGRGRGGGRGRRVQRGTSLHGRGGGRHIRRRPETPSPDAGGGSVATEVGGSALAAAAMNSVGTMRALSALGRSDDLTAAERAAYRAAHANMLVGQGIASTLGELVPQERQVEPPATAPPPEDQQPPGDQQPPPEDEQQARSPPQQQARSLGDQQPPPEDEQQARSPPQQQARSPPQQQARSLGEQPGEQPREQQLPPEDQQQAGSSAIGECHRRRHCHHPPPSPPPPPPPPATTMPPPPPADAAADARRCPPMPADARRRCPPMPTADARRCRRHCCHCHRFHRRCRVCPCVSHSTNCAAVMWVGLGGGRGAIRAAMKRKIVKRYNSPSSSHLKYSRVVTGVAVGAVMGGQLDRLPSAQADPHDRAFVESSDDDSPTGTEEAVAEADTQPGEGGVHWDALDVQTQGSNEPTVSGASQQATPCSMAVENESQWGDGVDSAAERRRQQQQRCVEACTTSPRAV
eukprot:SAG25_NODE_159_length_13431_cov_7.038629_3_plen_729_part_00